MKDYFKEMQEITRVHIEVQNEELSDIPNVHSHSQPIIVIGGWKQGGSARCLCDEGSADGSPAGTDVPE